MQQSVATDLKFCIDIGQFVPKDRLGPRKDSFAEHFDSAGTLAETGVAGVLVTRSL